jgi:hypothetical protein
MFHKIITTDAVMKFHIHIDSKLLLGFPFIGHANPDNNLGSLRIIGDLFIHYHPILPIKPVLFPVILGASSVTTPLILTREVQVSSRFYAY